MKHSISSCSAHAGVPVINSNWSAQPTLLVNIGRIRITVVWNRRRKQNSHYSLVMNQRRKQHSHLEGKKRASQRGKSATTLLSPYSWWSPILILSFQVLLSHGPSASWLLWRNVSWRLLVMMCEQHLLQARVHWAYASCLWIGTGGEGLVVIPKTVNGLEKTAAGLGGCPVQRVWFPQVIGAVCGTHIAVRSIVEDGPVLLDGKSSHQLTSRLIVNTWEGFLVWSGNPASMIILWCKQPFLAKAVWWTGYSVVKGALFDWWGSSVISIIPESGNHARRSFCLLWRTAPWLYQQKLAATWNPVERAFGMRCVLQ